MHQTLTIGMATYDDADGVYFTLEALRAYHPRCQYLVIDNAPKPCPRTLGVTNAVGGRYLHRPDLHGTSAPRDALFRLANTEWVMCLDSHVLIEAGGVQALLDYIEANPQSQDLIQGPLVHDDGGNSGEPNVARSGGMSTHWRPAVAPGLWGVWDTAWQAPDGTAFTLGVPTPESRGTPLFRLDGSPLPLEAVGIAQMQDGHDLAERLWAAGCVRGGRTPYEIPMQGLGLFAMRRAAWPGFHPLFRGFGGEEGYIHEKTRQKGGKCLCLPALGWRHRFRHMEHGAPPPPYRLTREDHVWNLLVGHRELGVKAVELIRKDFGGVLPAGVFEQLQQASEKAQPFGQHMTRKRLKLLGVWYSNNAAPEKLLQASLGTIQRAVQETMHHDVLVTTCSWEPIPGNPFPCNYRKPEVKGHAAIIEQIKTCLTMATPLSSDIRYWGPTMIPPLYRNGGNYDWDAVVFLEHDVLYPPGYFDRHGDMLASGAPVSVNFDYEGMNATGWLAVKERHEPMHQMAMRRDVALANLARAEEDCQRQGWCYLEPDSTPVIRRETEKGLLGVDFDGTLTAGWNPPSPDFVIITGRFPHEEAEVRKVVGAKRPIYFRTPEAVDDEKIGLFKARTIERLGVVEFWDDNPIHVAAIRRECPGVVIHHVQGPSPAPDRSAWARWPAQGLTPAIHVNH